MSITTLYCTPREWSGEEAERAVNMMNPAPTGRWKLAVSEEFVKSFGATNVRPCDYYTNSRNHWLFELVE